MVVRRMWMHAYCMQAIRLWWTLNVRALFCLYMCEYRTDMLVVRLLFAQFHVSHTRVYSMCVAQCAFRVCMRRSCFELNIKWWDHHHHQHHPPTHQKQRHFGCSWKIATQTLTAFGIEWVDWSSCVTGSSIYANTKRYSTQHTIQ